MKRIRQAISKITFLDWLLHLIGMHTIRKNNSGQYYCRLCGKEFDLKEEE